MALILCLTGFAVSQNHLLLSEIQVAPDAQEFIEIFNPNPFPILLENYYLSDYSAYYEVVANNFSTDPGDFLVRFPAGTQIDSGGVIVIALNGSGWTVPPDYEISGNSPATDMTSLYTGSSVALSNSEMIILFYWDGQSDLVADIDYVMWGSNPAVFVNKSGVSIDGPDPDTIPSAYQNDTPEISQTGFGTAPISGKSMARLSVTETGENLLNGNGITGHDETSEPVVQNFGLLNTPTPGNTDLQIPTGNGSGTARVQPDSIGVDSTVTLQFTLKGTIQENITDISLTIPASWSWAGSPGDVQIGGPGFSSAGFSVNGSVISINAAQVSLLDSGTVTVSNLGTPSLPEVSVFEVRTAVAGGTPAPISQDPAVAVWAPVVITPIALIQANPSAFTTVTIEGIVVLGSGITTTTWTDVYVQDNSGCGDQYLSQWSGGSGSGTGQSGKNNRECDGIQWGNGDRKLYRPGSRYR